MTVGHPDGWLEPVLEIVAAAGLAGAPSPDRDDAVPPYLYDHRFYTVTRDSLDVQRVQVHRLTVPGE